MTLLTLVWILTYDGCMLACACTVSKTRLRRSLLRLCALAHHASRRRSFTFNSIHARPVSDVNARHVILASHSCRGFDLIHAVWLDWILATGLKRFRIGDLDLSRCCLLSRWPNSASMIIAVAICAGGRRDISGMQEHGSHGCCLSKACRMYYHDSRMLMLLTTAARAE